MVEISIIIPTFNSAKTLAVCLDSILKQSFTDFEVLIMDGLSTDNTLEIAKSYDDVRLIISSEKDNGIYDAMNKGITQSKGEWIYFMGSDDSLYEPTTLEQFLNNEALKNNDVVYGNVFSTRYGEKYDGLFTYLKLRHMNICHQSIFFRKVVFDKIGNFNLKYKSLADWDHNIKWFFSDKIAKEYIDQIIANYVDGGYSSTYFDNAFKIDKNFLLLTKGLGKLPISELISCSSYSVTEAKREKKYLKQVFAQFLRFGLRVCKKLGFSKK